MKGTTLTIGGPPGSGKSTASRGLASALGREYVSAGEMFRAEATKRGMDLRAFSELAQKDERIDKALDEMMVGLASPRRVLEGRIIGELLSRRFVPVLRILITASEYTRAQRIGKREGVPADLVLPAMRAREQSEIMRYRRYYGFELEDLGYDIVVDSSRMDARQVVQAILEQLPTELKAALPA
jgi:CMP/dCMP kinase